MKSLKFLFTLAMLGVTVWVNAQDARPCDTAAAFLNCARAGTRKYQDQAVAIVDGYQRIGRDFPAMGEHWVNTGLLFDGKLDAVHPEVLTYITVSGRPQLLGIAYALPLLAGESVPHWPFGGAAWHDHFRTLDDETFLPLHHAGRDDVSPRISMLHAWIWLDNSEGIFAPDNWAIPYLRLSLDPPNPPPVAASKAISMITGGSDYFLTSIEAAAGLTASDRKTIQSAFRRTEARVRMFLSGRSVGPTLTPEDLDQLSTLWTNMWAAIDASVSKQTHLQLQGR